MLYLIVRFIPKEERCTPKKYYSKIVFYKEINIPRLLTHQVLNINSLSKSLTNSDSYYWILWLLNL